MSLLTTILAFTVVIGILVLVHEFGHYVAARLMGVRVETFSFGFGKRLFGKKVGDTDFRVSLVPLGGYVKMAGEEEWDPENLKPDEFQAKNRAQKIFILISGPFMNLLLAFVIFTGINITGVEVEAYKSQPPRIGYVEKRSPAEAAGIKKGDIIRRIDGHTIADWKELEITIGSNPNSELTVEYEREGQIIKKKLDVRSISRYSLGDAGIYWDYKTRIAAVNENSPASKAGLKPGDIIQAINRTPICHFEVSDVISGNPDKPLLFSVKRGDKEPGMEISIIPKKVYILESVPVDDAASAQTKLEKVKKAIPGLNFEIFLKSGYYRVISENLDSLEEAQKKLGTQGQGLGLSAADRGIIGVSMETYSPTVVTKYGFFEAMNQSILNCVKLTGLVFDAFKRMIIGKLSPKALSGPIEIAKISKKAIESGFSNFFLLIAFISLQLGLVNLFPIPALDGGHLMIYSLEAIIRKDFSQKVKGILMNIGFALLMALMAFVILNDFAKMLPHGWKSIFFFLK
jgi:regulator of sigma E protease